jgi:hypothetical protein
LYLQGVILAYLLVFLKHKSNQFAKTLKCYNKAHTYGEIVVMSVLFLEKGPVALEPVESLPNGLPHYGVHEVHFIDYDETAGRTQVALQGLSAVCHGLGFGARINGDILQQANAAVKSRGGAYNVLDTLTEKLTGAEIQAVRSEFRSAKSASSQLGLYPDAQGYLHRLNGARPATPNMFVTYGENADAYPDGGWQRDKIERSTNQAAVPMPGFAYITTEPVKGRMVQGFIDPHTNMYELVGYDLSGQPIARYSAWRSVLVDDKEVSLEGSPESCTPVHIRRKKSASEPQLRGTMPAHGMQNSSLDPIPVRKEVWPLNREANQRIIDHRVQHVAAFVPLKLAVERSPLPQLAPMINTTC